MTKPKNITIAIKQIKGLPLNISEVSQELGIPVRKLIYMDKTGLIPCIERSPKGHRLYSVDFVADIKAKLAANNQ